MPRSSGSSAPSATRFFAPATDACVTTVEDVADTLEEGVDELGDVVRDGVTVVVECEA